MAFIHISRISHNKPEFHLNALSIHRLLLTSIMVTVKYMDDSYYNNSFYSKIGGVALREINHLEIEFLSTIEFDLFIHHKVYWRFLAELRNPTLHPNCECPLHMMPADEESERGAGHLAAEQGGSQSTADLQPPHHSQFPHKV